MCFVESVTPTGTFICLILVFCSNCSVTLSFSVLPMEYHLTDLANVTHYIIEEKLMKPLRELYSVNPVAEYYRFKRRMMESPFEYHAVLIGNKHIVTFDGNIADLSSKCSLLLAKDFLHDTFTIILNQGTSGQRSLHIEMNQVAIDIYPGLKIEEDCQNLDLPTFKNGISIKKNANKIEVSNQEGITLQCDNHYDVCSITLEGWHHGVSAGLFGTNDNEAGNDLLLPDHSRTNSTHDFSLKWQVDSQCSSGRKKVKACTTAPHQKLCKAFFQGGQSVLRNCFRVVPPAPFYRMCVEDICDSHEIKPICNLAAAYVHLCNRNFVPIEIPSQCGYRHTIRFTYDHDQRYDLAVIVLSFSGLAHARVDSPALATSSSRYCARMFPRNDSTCIKYQPGEKITEKGDLSITGRRPEVGKG
ncbi:apolipophorin-like, partial [Ranitomeya imitator]|uniref:apolipophorin-like n=1 Tax=Ranitomeya imitator TaxID=111125 RepID=UPI0037E7F11E